MHVYTTSVANLIYFDTYIDILNLPGLGKHTI